MLTRVYLAALVALLSLPALVRAAPPAGPYIYEIGGNGEIWYPDGEATFCDPESGGSICVNTSAATDGTGAVTGTGTVTVHISDSDGQIDGDLPMTITGNLGGTTKAPHPKLVAAISGSLTFQNGGSELVVPFSGVSKYTCKDPLPHGALFECPGHLKLCGLFAGHKSCFNGKFGMNVGAAGGPWTLSTNLSTDAGNLVTGTGSAKLANDAAQDYVASGKYNAASGLSKLTLKAADPASKNKVAFAVTFGMYSPTSTTTIKFKVAGVSGSYVLSLAPP
ncbi:MAG TPA: hypothetical protein VMR50_09370 [Myxococcota bacterium]|nr:hypothetical protein [Myxococcota bacterium]